MHVAQKAMKISLRESKNLPPCHPELVSGSKNLISRAQDAEINSA